MGILPDHLKNHPNQSTDNADGTNFNDDGVYKFILDKSNDQDSSDSEEHFLSIEKA